MRAAEGHGSLMPPANILNAPTKLMKNLSYGKGYEYDHEAEDSFSGANYFPDGMAPATSLSARRKPVSSAKTKNGSIIRPTAAKKMEGKPMAKTGLTFRCLSR